MKVLAQVPYNEVIGTQIINETESEFTLFSRFKLRGYCHDNFLYIEVSGERSNSFFTIGTVGFKGKPISSVLTTNVVIVDGHSDFDIFVGVEITEEGSEERKVLIIPEEKIFGIENYRKVRPQLKVHELSKWKIRKWKIQSFLRKIKRKLKP